MTQETQDRQIRDMHTIINAFKRKPEEFSIAVCADQPKWITVSHGDRSRTYPSGPEAAVLLSAELRHGLFD